MGRVGPGGVGDPQVSSCEVADFILSKASPSAYRPMFSVLAL
jgi:hypothetical protein